MNKKALAIIVAFFLFLAFSVVTICSNFLLIKDLEGQISNLGDKNTADSKPSASPIPTALAPTATPTINPTPTSDQEK